MHIRVATPEDAAAIALIYIQGIEDRIATLKRARAPQQMCRRGLMARFPSWWLKMKRA